MVLEDYIGWQEPDRAQPCPYGWTGKGPWHTLSPEVHSGLCLGEKQLIHFKAEYGREFTYVDDWSPGSRREKED